MAKLFTTLALILSLLCGLLGTPPAKRAPEVELKAVLVADTHADANPIRDRMDLLREAFAGIGRTQADADCLVLAGDITNSGDLREYLFLQNILNAYCRIGVRLPELGNHDSWHHSDDPDYGKAARNFKAFCLMNGVCADKVYYRRDVGRIAFLNLGSEGCDFGDMILSDAQLDWLDRELADACAGGRPVFVICHKPFEKIGPCAEPLERILTARAETADAPIIVVSGHNHDIGENTFRRPAENLVCLNLPSLIYTGAAGLGFVAEVTAEGVALTGMNFVTGETLAGYRWLVQY